MITVISNISKGRLLILNTSTLDITIGGHCLFESNLLFSCIFFKCLLEEGCCGHVSSALLSLQKEASY